MQRLRKLAATCTPVLALLLSLAFAAAAQTTTVTAKPSEPQGIMGLMADANGTAAALINVAREKKLAVLNDLASGRITAEQALDALDALPAPASHYQLPDGKLVMVTVAVKQGSGDVSFSVPFPVVQWLIVEGPKLVPPNVSEGISGKTGMDIKSIDLSGLGLALSSLANVKEATTVLEVNEGAQMVKITVVPVQ